MAGARERKYRAEPADQLLIEALDAMTAIYHKRSGITHIVAEPVPEMLSVMGHESFDAAGIADRLAARFDVDAGEALVIVEARLEELAALGLVNRCDA